MDSLQKLILYKYALFKQRKKKKRISNKFKQVSRKGIFPIDFKSHHGIGAKLIWCLEVILYCQKKNLKPVFKFSFTDSAPSDDFFSAYFQTDQQEKKIEFIEVANIGEAGLDKNYNKELTLELASELINKYIRPVSEINLETEAFCKQHLGNKKTLGVHFRSTDKISEAPAVSKETVLKNIEYCLTIYPNLEKIFITTDDKNFLKFMLASHLSNRIVFRDDSFRAIDHIGIHNRADLNKYDVNKDAIMNILILTKCDFILKSASFMSSIALLYNPAIPFAMLNKPIENKLWFPESELIKKTAFEPLN